MDENGGRVMLEANAKGSDAGFQRLYLQVPNPRMFDGGWAYLGVGDADRRDGFDKDETHSHGKVVRQNAFIYTNTNIAR